MRLHRDSTALLVVDIQSRLAPAMHQSESAIQANSALIQAARQLNVPIFASEHCAERIGPTVPDLRALLRDDEILPKAFLMRR
jgi:nicotinamidase-related amidase